MPPSGGAPTNEQIVQLLEAIRAELAEARRRQDRIALDNGRLLAKKSA
jgi:hypothetical protein